MRDGQDIQTTPFASRLSDLTGASWRGFAQVARAKRQRVPSRDVSSEREVHVVESASWTDGRAGASNGLTAIPDSPHLNAHDDLFNRRIAVGAWHALGTLGVCYLGQLLLRPTLIAT